MGNVVEKVNKDPDPKKSFSAFRDIRLSANNRVSHRVNFFNKKLQNGGEKMPEVWTGEIVKRMHLNNVSANEIAKEAGVTSAYVSMLLHSKRTPDGAQEMLEAALDAIIERKEAEQ